MLSEPAQKKFNQHMYSARRYLVMADSYTRRRDGKIAEIECLNSATEQIEKAKAICLDPNNRSKL